MQLPLWISVGFALVVLAAWIVPFLLASVAPPRTAHGRADTSTPRADVPQVPTLPEGAERRRVVGRDTLAVGGLTAVVGMLLLRAYLDWTALTVWPWLVLVAVCALAVAYAVSSWPRLDARSARWNKRQGRWVRAGRAWTMVSLALLVALGALLLVVILR